MEWSFSEARCWCWLGWGGSCGFVVDGSECSRGGSCDCAEPVAKRGWDLPFLMAFGLPPIVGGLLMALTEASCGL
jgi:hypothetical protein